MIKKKVKKEEVVKEEVSVPTAFIESKIGALEFDFGRGDLNLMRDKLNEVIKHINGN